MGIMAGGSSGAGAAEEAAEDVGDEIQEELGFVRALPVSLVCFLMPGVVY